MFLPDPQTVILFQHRQSFFPDIPGTEPDKYKDDNEQRVYRRCFIHRVIENSCGRHIYVYGIAVQQLALLKVDAGEQPLSLENTRLDIIRRIAAALRVIDDFAFILEIVRNRRGRYQDLARGVVNNAKIARNDIRNTLKVHVIDIFELRPLEDQPSILQPDRIVDPLVSNIIPSV